MITPLCITWRHGFVVALLMTYTATAFAQQSPARGASAVRSTPPEVAAGALDSATLAANQRLDQAFLDAHAAKSAAAVVRLFSRRPDIVFVAPNGVVNRGRAAILASFNLLFPHIEAMHGQIRDVTYVRVSDSVVAAAGIEVFTRQRKDGITDERQVVWTDVRVRENGEWRYITRHSHWPVAPDAPTPAPTPAREP